MNSNSAPQAYLVGIGAGQLTGLTTEAKKIIESATLVCGAKRILESVKDIVHGNTFDSYDSEEILKKFEEEKSSKTNAIPVAVFSGDTGFFSGSAKLTALLEENNWTVHVLPGISSVQCFASRLKKNWQDWKLVSAHGTDCNIGAELAFSKSVFFLTGGKISAKTIVRFINQNEIPAKIYVGSNLGYQTEKITEFPTFGESEESGESGKNQICDWLESGVEEKLSVVLVEQTEFREKTCPGIPDEDFLRAEKVPMTKRLVRAAIIALMETKNDEIVWDIGCGSGAVSIELCRSAKCTVYGVEHNKAAYELEKQNRKKFAAWNLNLVFGEASESVKNLPAPDAVFIGGSEGKLDKIIDEVILKNPRARILISSVTLETLSQSQEIAAKKNMQIEVSQLAVAKSALLGTHHLLRAENPICLISLKT